MASTTRRFAAILAADVAGYSRLRGADDPPRFPSEVRWASLSSVGSNFPVLGRGWEWFAPPAAYRATALVLGQDVGVPLPPTSFF